MRWLFMIMILTILSCADDSLLEQKWIENETVRRVEEYRIKKRMKCHDELISRVLRDADSIVLDRSRFDIPDSLEVPEKQLRPMKPNIAFPEFRKPKNPTTDSTTVDSL